MYIRCHAIFFLCGFPPHGKKGNMVEFKSSFLSPSPSPFQQSVPEVLARMDSGRSRAGCGINQHGGSGSKDGPGRWLYVLQASVQPL